MQLALVKKSPLAALAAMIGALFATAPAAADEAAEAYVQAILDEADPVLKASDEAERLAGIEALVDKYVDMRRIGMFTLGQYARQITDEQKEEYLPLFKEYATLIYRDSLTNYSGQTLRVAGSIDRSARDIIVSCNVVDAQPGDQFADITVYWRVYRSREGDMTIVDAGADNIWLAIEQRSQFTSIIANNGGGTAGIDALIAEIRDQVGS